jgi:hypothetical protein
MKKVTIFTFSFLTLPLVTHAQDVQSFVINFVLFINRVVIPFLLGIAFLIFVINAIRFFVLGGSNQDSQEKARSLALYSILAFLLIFTFWGFVNIFVTGIGLGGGTQPVQDYVEMKSTP